jgi:hypothetical protein
MIIKGTLDGFPVIYTPVVFEFLFSNRCPDLIYDVKSSEGTDPVESIWPSQFAIEWKFEE